MRITKIHASNLPDAFFQTMHACATTGVDYHIEHGSFARAATRRQLEFLVLNIIDPAAKPLLPEPPPHLHIPPPVDGGIEHIERNYLPYILTEDKTENEQYTYGRRLVSQLEKIADKLSKYPNGNQTIASISRPSDIFLSDPPCLRSVNFKLSGECQYAQLNLFIHFRSWDIYNGFPANLAALVYLQEYVCELVRPAHSSVKPGEFLCFSEGAHLYNHQFRVVSKWLGINI